MKNTKVVKQFVFGVFVEGRKVVQPVLAGVFDRNSGVCRVENVLKNELFKTGKPWKLPARKEGTRLRAVQA